MRLLGTAPFDSPGSIGALSRLLMISHMSSTVLIPVRGLQLALGSREDDERH